MISHLKTIKQFQVTRENRPQPQVPQVPQVHLLQPLEALRAVFEGTIEAAHLRMGCVHAAVVLLDVANPETCGETCGKT
jgi:hypothetical protein